MLGRRRGTQRTGTGWLALHLAVSSGHFHAEPAAAAPVLQPGTTGDGEPADHHGREACAICAILHIDSGALRPSAPALPLPVVAAAVSPDDLRAEVSYTWNAVHPRRDQLSAVTVGVNGTNLLNRTIRNSASYSKDEVLMPGLGVRLFASVKY